MIIRDFRKVKPEIRRLKNAEVADITRSDESEAVVLGEVDTMLARYVELKHKSLEPDEGPTIEQLSVLERVVTRSHRVRPCRHVGASWSAEHEVLNS